MNIFELHLTHTTFSRVLSCLVPMVDAQEGENKAEGILLIWSAPEMKYLIFIDLKTWVYCSDFTSAVIF